jgi:hypothetical protein
MNKTSKNTDLKPLIVCELLKIAGSPAKILKRYTIGFDANSLSILRSKMGYRLFGRLIRQSVLNKSFNLHLIQHKQKLKVYSYNIFFVFLNYSLIFWDSV